MSAENVEIVRGFYDAFARDEFPVELMDPQLEYVNPVGWFQEPAGKAAALEE